MSQLRFNIKITNIDIERTEKILLNEDKFDEERKRFIKCLETKDLKACPGSGKTTCLLAKLLILEKFLPFDDGSGVLVLSHTNAAIDRIKDEIGFYCPYLFSYPNFIGTIQSFVDKFLAIPYYTQVYSYIPYRIDDEIYNEVFKKKFYIFLNLEKKYDNKSIIHFYKANEDRILKYGFHFSDSSLVKVDTLEEIEIKKPKKKNSKNYTDYTDDEKTEVKDFFENYIDFILKNERVLRYYDAYFFAHQYTQKYPQIIRFFQKRFSFVFFDEMQDTDKHQLDLIDTLFKNSEETVIQRIGDPNQAIYGKTAKSENVWSPPKDSFKLNGSLRLSTEIAKTIKNICLYPYELIGNEKRKKIKPIILIFDNNTIKNNKVIQKFGDLIIENKLHLCKEKTNLSKKVTFKAIGWVKTKDDDKKENEIRLGITDYFNDYKKEIQIKKIDFNNLKSYLVFIDRKLIEKEGLNIIRKNILNAFLKVLRLANIKIEGKNITENSFFKSLREKDKSEYENFKLKLYQWCIESYKGNEKVDEYIKYYITNNFCKIFTFPIKEDIKNFLDNQDPYEGSMSIIKANKIYKYIKEGNELIEIEVDTIHSAKGETHTATLYLETFYHGHESEKILDQLLGNVYQDKLKIKNITLKMACVGMSRPTELLCLAIHKNHIKEKDQIRLAENWKIIDLTYTQ